MLYYGLVLVASFLVDCIPVFAPPAWTLMMFFMLKYNLNPYVVALVGTVGTVSGRFVFSSYIVPWVGSKTLSFAKEEDLKFVGAKLSNKGIWTFVFIFAYSILPLSTTALFTAAGLAKIRRIFVLPPFFLGNLVGDTAILVSGKYAIHSFDDMYKGSMDVKSIILTVLSLLIVLMFLFVDWRELIENGKLQLKWRFWR